MSLGYRKQRFERLIELVDEHEGDCQGVDNSKLYVRSIVFRKDISIEELELILEFAMAGDVAELDLSYTRIEFDPVIEAKIKYARVKSIKWGVQAA